MKRISTIPIAAAIALSITVSAQNNASAPGLWGSPWLNTDTIDRQISVKDTSMTPNRQNSGYTTVIACGYDAQGIWRTIPIHVRYRYNGIRYDVDAINAWNPWTDSWNCNVDTPAINTEYLLHGNEFSFYVVLSTGTYYFNL